MRRNAHATEEKFSVKNPRIWDNGKTTATEAVLVASALAGASVGGHSGRPHRPSAESELLFAGHERPPRLLPFLAPPSLPFFFLLPCPFADRLLTLPFRPKRYLDLFCLQISAARNPPMLHGGGVVDFLILLLPFNLFARRPLLFGRRRPRSLGGSAIAPRLPRLTPLLSSSPSYSDAFTRLCLSRRSRFAMSAFLCVRCLCSAYSTSFSRPLRPMHTRTHRRIFPWLQ